MPLQKLLLPALSAASALLVLWYSRILVATLERDFGGGGSGNVSLSDMLGYYDDRYYRRDGVLNLKSGGRGDCNGEEEEDVEMQELKEIAHKRFRERLTLMRKRCQEIGRSR